MPRENIHSQLAILQERWDELWRAITYNSVQDNNAAILIAVAFFRRSLEEYLIQTKISGNQEELMRIVDLLIFPDLDVLSLKSHLQLIDLLNLGLVDYALKPINNSIFAGENNIIADKYYKVSSTLTILRSIIFSHFTEEQRKDLSRLSECDERYLTAAKDLIGYFALQVNLSLLRKAYSDLHLVKGQKLKEVDNLILGCRNCINAEDLLTYLVRELKYQVNRMKEKYPKKFETTSGMTYELTSLDNQAYLTLLNTEKNKHHYNRLFIILMNDAIKRVSPERRMSCGLNATLEALLSTIDSSINQTKTPSLFLPKPASVIYNEFVKNLEKTAVINTVPRMR